MSPLQLCSSIGNYCGESTIVGLSRRVNASDKVVSTFIVIYGVESQGMTWSKGYVIARENFCGRDNHRKHKKVFVYVIMSKYL